MTAFSVIFAVTTLVHRVAFPTWLSIAHGPLGVLNVVSAIWLLSRPTSTRAFGALVVTGLAEVVRMLPQVPNHFVFEALVHLTMLIALVSCGLRDRGRRIDRAELLRAFAPAVRVELILLYAFTVLHKLNTSFFDPAVSCAAEMHHELAEIVPIIPGGPWTAWPAIAGTIAFEAGIPLLLAFRRSAHLGIVCGVFFQALLSLHPHPGVFSFSASMYALFFLFLSPRAVDELVAFWHRGSAAWRRMLPAISPTLTVVLVFWLTITAEVLLGFSRRIGFWPSAAWGVFLAVSYAVAMVRARDGRPLPVMRGTRLSPAWVVVPIVVFNGFCPYLGLKTVTTFSMFSNLRTESNPNHLFMPQLHVWDFQTDVVEIARSSHHGSRDECEPHRPGLWCSFTGERVPYFELKRWTSTARIFSDEPLEVEFRRGGRMHVLSPDGDPDLAEELYTPHPWLLAKLMVLRKVQTPDGPMPCAW